MIDKIYTCARCGIKMLINPGVTQWAPEHDCVKGKYLAPKPNYPKGAAVATTEGPEIVELKDGSKVWINEAASFTKQDWNKLISKRPSPTNSMIEPRRWFDVPQKKTLAEINMEYFGTTMPWERNERNYEKQVLGTWGNEAVINDSLDATRYAISIGYGIENQRWIEDYFKVPLPPIVELEKLRNQLNLNKKMKHLTPAQQAKLDRLNFLAGKISSMKDDIKKIELSYEVHKGCETLNFSLGNSTVRISPEYIDFPVIKKQVLASMNKELKVWEKEFEGI